MASNLYRGFSTHEYATKNTFSVRDLELVKLDILNHIFTTKGSRVMMASFGTTIPELIFEPLDSITIETLQEELRRVVAYDPRVSLQQLNLKPDYDNSSVTVEITLLYIELNMTDIVYLHLNFEGD